MFRVNDMSKNENKKKVSGFTIVVIGIVLFVVFALLFVVVFNIELKKNELEEEILKQTELRDELRYENEKKKNELEKDLDDETVREVAKDKLGLVEPNSEYYYGD